MSTVTSIVKTEKLSVVYKTKKNKIYAVDNINIDIKKGQTLTIIGESGSGKTTLGMAILRLIKITSGKIFFKNIDITNMKENELRNLRRYMQLVPQDPYSSMNPKIKVKNIITGPIQGKIDMEKIEKTLESVGLDDSVLERYPHELSGGQRQRILIARALVGDPEFLVLDEPTSNLDVSIQAQILNLLLDIQRSRNLTYLFITHNMAVAKYISDRIAVMYSGKIIEIGNVKDIIENPLHPYTQELFNAIPDKNFRFRLKNIMINEISNFNHIIGCKYSSRCKFAKEICNTRNPELINVKNEHYVACFLY